MKYSLDASVLEVRKRRDERLRERKRRKVGSLSGSAALLAALLLAAFHRISVSGGMIAEGSVYGAFLLSPAAGGYVLVGVVAFIAGAAIAAALIRRRKRTKDVRKGRSGDRGPDGATERCD